jgi:hypothetical protein
MINFTDFLLSEEAAYYLLEGPPAPGNQLFHKDLGIPPTLAQGPPAGMKLYYRGHPIDRATQKEIRNLPPYVPANYTLIEVESHRGAPVKWVIRTEHFNDPQNDLVIVILPNGSVKTVWLNDKRDTHRTLNRSYYTPLTVVQRR